MGGLTPASFRFLFCEIILTEITGKLTRRVYRFVEKKTQFLLPPLGATHSKLVFLVCGKLGLKMESGLIGTFFCFVF